MVEGRIDLSDGDLGTDHFREKTGWINKIEGILFRIPMRVICVWIASHYRVRLGVPPPSGSIPTKDVVPLSRLRHSSEKGVTWMRVMQALRVDT